MDLELPCDMQGLTRNFSSDVGNNNLTSHHNFRAKFKWSDRDITLGTFTYYVITEGEGGFRNDYADVILALSNAEFDYARGSRNKQK